MAKSAKDMKEILPDFQQFLRDRRLSPEKNIPFLAYWISRFLTFMRKRDFASEDYNEPAVIEFLNMLREDEKVLDWQPRQADDAIKLYYFHYIGKSAVQVPAALKRNEVPAALEEVTRLIRLRHYSYSTERTYLQWIERFFSYSLTGGRTPADLTAKDFRDFLSHLALKQRVASSTQNQAFNAVLFLFRHVLGKDTGDMSTTVRAKRGQKLPVVFTIDEVKQIFEHMSAPYLLLAELLYGAGLRLMELARMRVKDIDFNSATIFVRSGKGDKDRSTVLPTAVKERLLEHLKGVKELHEKDLAVGYGRSRCLMPLGANIRMRERNGRGSMFFHQASYRPIRGAEG